MSESSLTPRADAAQPKGDAREWSITKADVEDLHADEAYVFYAQFIYNQEHQDVLRKHGFRIPGSIASVNWEAFAAILLGETKKPGYGCDLGNYEVKSAKIKSSYEYQYHKHGWDSKLTEDGRVQHLFVSYSDDYGDVRVLRVPGATLRPMFEAWRPLASAAYAENRQRFRKAVAHGFVMKYGEPLVTITSGKLVPPVERKAPSC